MFLDVHTVLKAKEYELSLSRKNTVIIYVNGYRYGLKRTALSSAKPTTFNKWACTNKLCRGKALQRRNGELLLIGKHNHASTEPPPKLNILSTDAQ